MRVDILTEKKNKAIFLDRDGTLNEEVDYLHEWQKMVLIPGTVEALKILQEKGYLLVVVTNQSGVARGYFTMKEVDEVNQYMSQCLEKEGVHIERFYCCPHGASDGCQCRKPQPHMYLQAAKDFNIDVTQSYLVGDKISDIQAAFSMNAGFGLVLSGHDIEEQWIQKYRNHCYKNLLEFAESI